MSHLQSTRKSNRDAVFPALKERRGKLVTPGVVLDNLHEARLIATYPEHLPFRSVVEAEVAERDRSRTAHLIKNKQRRRS